MSDETRGSRRHSCKVRFDVPSPLECQRLAVGRAGVGKSVPTYSFWSNGACSRGRPASHHCCRLQLASHPLFRGSSTISQAIDPDLFFEAIWRTLAHDAHRLHVLSPGVQPSTKEGNASRLMKHPGSSAAISNRRQFRPTWESTKTVHVARFRNGSVLTRSLTRRNSAVWTSARPYRFSKLQVIFARC